jgi:hypothetical protein
MTTDDSVQDSTSEAIKEPPSTNESSTEANNAPSEVEDSGILDFMTADMAIELYQRIRTKGLPDLDWKFYGRRKPNEAGDSDAKDNQCDTTDGVSSKEQQEQDNDNGMFDNTEFDFDESLSELQAETSAISDSLQLKKRQGLGSERKTNLSDIMSDILKETSHTEPEGPD